MKIEEMPILDVDCHVTEPADVWTSRVPAKWRDRVPHIRRDSETGQDEWWIENTYLFRPGYVSVAGWHEHLPSCPATFDDIDPAAYDAKARLKRMDEWGIWSQVMYPNILGFFSYVIRRMPEPDLRLACIQAYNDWLAEWASEDPRRLIPIMSLPDWDVEASLVEIKRCHDLGYKGINFAWDWAQIGLPHLASDHWYPIYAEAQDRGLPINFHVGNSEGLKSHSGSDQNEDKGDEVTPVSTRRSTGGSIGRLGHCRDTAAMTAGNQMCIASLIMDGVCQAFPRLPFVSVESGWGYMPYYLEMLDWQFKATGAFLEVPDWPLPSDQFRRQIYATFWFERSTLSLLEQYPDNGMFSTDFPHPTSLTPSPLWDVLPARAHACEVMAGLSEETARKALGGNAARVYGLELPTLALS